MSLFMTEKLPHTIAKREYIFVAICVLVFASIPLNLVAGKALLTKITSIEGQGLGRKPLLGWYTRFLPSNSIRSIRIQTWPVFISPSMTDQFLLVHQWQGIYRVTRSLIYHKLKNILLQVCLFIIRLNIYICWVKIMLSKK